MKGLIVSSGYYLLEEYMKYSDDIYALIIGDEKKVPSFVRDNKRIFFSSSYDASGIIKKIMGIGIKFQFIYCIDDKFIDRIGEISDSIGIPTCQISGEITRDKYLLKQYLEKENILFPATRVFENMTEVKECQDIDFPTIIKPSNSYGSNGVFLVNNYEEFLRYSKCIFKQNIVHQKFYSDSSAKLLCEDYISGEEFAVDVFWNNAEPKCSLISSRLHNIVGNMFPDYVYYIDKDLTNKKKEMILKVAHQVGHAIGIKTGVTHTELREKNGKLYILENAVRPGGGGCMYQLHRNKTSVDYFELYMRTMSNERIDEVLSETVNYENVYYFFMTYANSKFGVVKDIGVCEENLSNKITITKKSFLVNPGDRIMPNEECMRYTIFIFGTINAENKEQFSQLINGVNNACYINMEGDE